MMGRALSLSVDRRKLSELAIAAATCGVLAAGMYRWGVPLVLFITVLATTAVAALWNAQILAFVLLMLAPLPSLGAALGFDLPLGVEPLNLFLLVALALAFMRGLRPLPLRSNVLGWLVALNFALFAVAWYRTYGQGEVRLAELAILAKPIVILLAGLLAVQLLDPDRATSTIARVFALSLMVIGTSVLLQRVGVYAPSFADVTATRSSVIKYGGILLGGNTAGPVVAIFTLPAYILLRTSGAHLLGLVLVALAFPVLLTTLSRGSMLAFAVALFAFAFLQRGRVRNAAIVAGVILCAVGWTVTAGVGEREFILGNFERYRYDTNAQLSGRTEIWDAAREYLSQTGHLLFGGGLDDFREFATTTSLEASFSTHNSFLFIMTAGGLVFTVAMGALLVWLLAAPGARDPAVRDALRLATIGMIVAGLSSADVTPLNPIAAWLWALVALAYGARQGATWTGPAGRRDGALLHPPTDRSPPPRLGLGS